MDETLLKLRERVDLAIEIGESYYREFKSAFEGPPGAKKPRDVREISVDVAKTLVAFANADGGELFIGIEDDNLILGTSFNDESMTLILQSYKTHVHPDTPIRLKKSSIIDYDGKKLIYFSVDKGLDYVYLTAKGECFQRRDKESVPTAAEKILNDRQEVSSKGYDREFVDAAKISDLDLELISKVSAGIIKNISPEKFLQYLDLAEFNGERLALRKAALLLFAKNPIKWHPRQQVRILKVRGTSEKSGDDYNITEIGEVVGNIFELIEKSWEILRPNLTETRFTDALFKTQIIYPEYACKEALINAITHRDYSNEGRGIEIKIYDDRLTFSNPGQLLDSITIADIEQLKGVHLSRNTYIARALRETGFVRELGEGMQRIFALMKSNDLVNPRLESTNNQFSITLFYKHVYSREEKLWLDQFEALKLTREQKTVVRLGINGKLVSAKEIFEQVGIVDEAEYRLLIESLSKLGILENKYSQLELSKISRQSRISRKAVPKYQISMPMVERKASVNLDNSDYAKVFVNNIPFDASIEEIETAFSKFGEIVDISLPQHHYYKGRNRGFCFIEFDKIDDAFKAFRSEDPTLVKDRVARIQMARKT